ncbi:hypothetical protein [Nostoc sp. DSM 114159]
MKKPKLYFSNSLAVIFDDEVHSINYYWLTTPLHQAIASGAFFDVVCHEKYDMSA